MIRLKQTNYIFWIAFFNEVKSSREKMVQAKTYSVVVSSAIQSSSVWLFLKCV